MEVSMFSGYPDLGMMNNDLNYFHNQLQVNLLEDLLLESSLLPSHGNSFDQLETNQGLISCKRSPQSDLHHTTPVENPIKKLKRNNNNWDSYDHQMNHHVLNSSQDQHDYSNSTMLSFSNSSNSSTQTSTLITPKEEAISNNNNNLSFPFHHEMVVNQHKQSCIFESRPHQVVDKKSVKVVGSTPSQAMDHIIAERKRREKLSQRFIALSAVIPGLKKMDKASVLGDAIKYVKQMQEKVKKLEEEAKKKTVESAILVKRSYVSAEDNDNHFSAKSTATDNAAASCCKASFPEIEVRFSDKDVLITAHCEQKKGMSEKLISQIEKLHLTVISSSSLAFGGSALAVTITAQMDAEYSMTAKDLVRHLHSTLK